MAQSCSTRVVRPQPLTRQSARNIHIRSAGAMPLKKNSTRLAAAAIAVPTAQTSFLPIVLASFGMKNISTIIGEYVHA